MAETTRDHERKNHQQPPEPRGPTPEEIAARDHERATATPAAEPPAPATLIAGQAVTAFADGAPLDLNRIPATKPY